MPQWHWKEARRIFLLPHKKWGIELSIIALPKSKWFWSPSNKNCNKKQSWFYREKRKPPKDPFESSFPRDLEIKWNIFLEISTMSVLFWFLPRHSFDFPWFLQARRRRHEFTSICTLLLKDRLIFFFFLLKLWLIFDWTPRFASIREMKLIIINKISDFSDQSMKA